MLRVYERHLLPRVFARATRLVAVSPVATAVHTGRAEIIAPGVDTAVFAAPAADVVRERSVVYVGRVETTSRWKGVDVLLDAFAKLLAECADATLVVVGDGDARVEYERLAESLGVAGSVRWLGALAPTGVNAVLQHAGVAVLPSLTESESFGMALIEAMSSGCPVVGSDVGGIPHVIRDGVDGLLVPPGDSSALATALLTVLGDGETAARLGRAGREAAEQRWDWSNQRARMLAEFDRAQAGATVRTRKSGPGARRRRRIRPHSSVAS
jgi:glycosyltransferase involved in cell wall biosynthesis